MAPPNSYTGIVLRDILTTASKLIQKSRHDFLASDGDKASQFSTIGKRKATTFFAMNYVSPLSWTCPEKNVSSKTSPFWFLPKFLHCANFLLVQCGSFPRDVSVPSSLPKMPICAAKLRGVVGSWARLGSPFKEMTAVNPNLEEDEGGNLRRERDNIRTEKETFLCENRPMEELDF